MFLPMAKLHNLLLDGKIFSDPSQIRWIGRFFLAIFLNQVDLRKVSSCYADPDGSEESFCIAVSGYR